MEHLDFSTEELASLENLVKCHESEFQTLVNSKWVLNGASSYLQGNDTWISSPHFKAEGLHDRLEWIVRARMSPEDITNYDWRLSLKIDFPAVENCERYSVKFGLVNSQLQEVIVKKCQVVFTDSRLLLLRPARISGLLNDYLNRESDSFILILQMTISKSWKLDVQNNANDFGKMFLMADVDFFSDVTLHAAEGGKLRAHKNILAHGSPVFSQMFQEMQLLEYVIENVEYRALSDLIYWMYSGTMRNLDLEETKGMFRLAMRFLVLRLKKRCENRIIEEFLTQHTAVEVLMFANDVGSETLKDAAIQRIIRNKEVFDAATLSVLGTDLLAELTIASFKK